MGVSMKEAAKAVPWEEMAQKARAMGEAVKDKIEDLAEAAQEKAAPWCSCCAPAVDKNEIKIEPQIQQMQ